MPLLLALLSTAGVLLPTAGSAQDLQGAVANPEPRLIFWVDCEKDVLGLSNAELERWKRDGVDGFVCMVGRLRGLGGTQDFTGNPQANLHSANYQLQRRLRDSQIVQRAAARGLKLYLGVYFANYYNRATPLAEWFGPKWNQQVLPRLGDLAAAAAQLGFAGLAFDQELYEQEGGANSATWKWDYPGNRRSESEVREQARHRGAQVMSTILASFPGVELAVYHARFPRDWSEVVQENVNGLTGTSSERLDVDFWDGMSGVEGYEAIRFYDATFYKSPHLGEWDHALTYLQNSTYATFSQQFENWKYAWRRVHVAPFAWIDDGPSDSLFDDASSPAEVAEQLLAFRRWTAGGEFANFAYGGLDSFDYGPYAAAMREASSPGPAGGVRPALQVTGASRVGRRTVIQGTATAERALRAVRWRAKKKRAGVAVLHWNVLSGDARDGFRWETNWSIVTRALRGRVSKLAVKAVDIGGRSSRRVVVRKPDRARG